MSLQQPRHFGAKNRFGMPSARYCWTLYDKASWVMCRRIATIALLCLVLFFPGGRVWCAHPDSPEVRTLIENGLSYLETVTSEQRLGGVCLIGMAFHKNGRPASHPAVARAIEACRRAVAPSNGSVQQSIYSLGLAVIFLCGLRDNDYSDEIRLLLAELEKNQKPHGGWGYRHLPTGDTSMSQYGVLSSWEAHQAGHKVSKQSVLQVCHWLLRTQDPDGGWGYQGNDPGNFELIAQSAVSHSLSAAGLGSTYLCADVLGARGFDYEGGGAGVSSALRRVKPAATGDRSDDQPEVSLNRPALKAAVARGNAWFQKNFQIDPKQWTHYYLYGLERYQSIREAVEGNVQSEPTWYNAGVEYLAETQQEDGSWRGEGATDTPATSTAFSVLFLSRSMKKSITRARGYREGLLTGGRGLPSNLSEAEIRGGKIVVTGAAANAMSLIEVLSDPNDPDYDYLVENPEQMLADAVRDADRQELASLRKLIREGAPEARLVAVRTLARRRDLDHVPDLIHALTDPDWRVVVRADDGLRFISRHLDQPALPERRSETARKQAIAAWTQWYRTIRPNAELPTE